MSDSNVFSKKYNEQFSFSIGETYIDSVTIYPPSLNIDKVSLNGGCLELWISETTTNGKAE